MITTLIVNFYQLIWYRRKFEAKHTKQTEQIPNQLRNCIDKLVYISSNQINQVRQINSYIRHKLERNVRIFLKLYSIK